jgi:hypothetical protein
MKKALILSLSFIIISCSKDLLFNKDQVEISKELKRIKNADSGVRNYGDYINFRYGLRDFDTVSDSLDEINRFEDIKKIDFSKIPSKNQQMQKWSNRKSELYLDRKKEGERMMEYVDKINREKLYQIIKKYGFPSFYNRKWKDTTELRVGTAFIYSHFNYEDKEEKKLLRLLIKEYFSGRVEINEMKHIMWSVEGRNGYPYEYILDKKNLKDKLKSL